MKENHAMVFKTNIPADYAGGYVGVGTAENSAVVFQNTICTTVNWITNLAPVQALNATLTESPKGLRITKNGGSDAWAMSRIRADKNFTLETDVSFESGNVVNLIFGANSRAANNPSYVFKFDRTNYAQTKLFHYGNWSVYQSSTENSFERNKERYKLKFEATDTEFIAYVDDAEVFRTNILADYAGGYIGIGVAENSTVVFQNTSYTATKWNTNLTPVQALNATLTETANGLHITGNGNAWAMSSIQADTDFTPRPFTEIPFLNQISAWAEDNIVLRFSKSKEYPCVNVQAGLRWTMIQPGRAEQMSTLSPRVNASLEFCKWAGFRFGFGLSEKSPSLLSLYPERTYLDYLNDLHARAHAGPAEPSLARRTGAIGVIP